MEQQEQQQETATSSVNGGSSRPTHSSSSSSSSSDCANISSSSFNSPPESRTTTPRFVDLQCLLCTETVRVLSSSSPKRFEQAGRRPCCQQTCCNSCLYRHMITIWEDTLVGGQRPLTCPAGCGQVLSDRDIRTCLHRQHENVIWQWIGSLLYSLCLFFGLLLEGVDEPGSLQSCVRYRLWSYFLHTQKEQRDLARYEQWSISVGLRSHTNNNATTTYHHENGMEEQEDEMDDADNNNNNMDGGSSNRRPEQTARRSSIEPMIVQHCPAPNCNYSWIVADSSHRREKQLHERRRVLLWYSPPEPEPDDNKDTTETMPWVEAEFLHFGTRDSPPPPVDWDHDASLFQQCTIATTTTRNRRPIRGCRKKDGRRMVCAKCHYVFCGLCRQPWMFLRNHHAGKSCRAYQRSLQPLLAQAGHGGGGRRRDSGATPGDLASLAAHTIGARMCPGCNTLTSRISGCNHITCPCGCEWCFVCGANWTPWHYACTESSALQLLGRARRLGNNNNDNNDDCVIL